jgi:hypothetical protein
VVVVPFVSVRVTVAETVAPGRCSSETSNSRSLEAKKVQLTVTLPTGGDWAQTAGAPDANSPRIATTATTNGTAGYRVRRKPI